MNKSHIRKKKAFTLTELLVVVIVIGVLSAVVLPKFSKVVETRKTTEAEEIMAAVRTEQEKRCTLDKNYLTQLTEIKDIVPAENTKNFSYSLTATGMEAQSKGKYGYTLKMPSYADGRICCENEAECAKLNKDYPLCSALIAQADYRSGAECAGEPEEKQCTGSATESCGCLGKGFRTRTCDTSTGTWSNWGACSIADACDCASVSGPKPADKSLTCNTCGTQSASYSCDSGTGQWKLGSYGACSKTAQECACQNPPAGEASTRNCPEGYTGTQSRTWDSASCKWSDWSGECTPDCVDSYGTPTSGATTDSCDGDTNARFTCASRPGFKGTCTDSYTTNPILSGVEVDWDKVSIDKIKNPGILDKSVLEQLRLRASLKTMSDGSPAPSFYYAVGNYDMVLDKFEPIDQFDPCPHGHCCCYTCECYERTPGYGLCPGVVCGGIGDIGIGGGIDNPILTKKAYHRKVTCCGN